MNKATRKVNLKKLQLNAANNVRNPRSKNDCAKISEFFDTPQKTRSTQKKSNDEQDPAPNRAIEESEFTAKKEEDVVNSGDGAKCIEENDFQFLRRRTKLTAFALKKAPANGATSPPSTTAMDTAASKRHSNSEAVFECTEEKKVKKAPKPKTSKSRKRHKQMKIDSAFYRNEKLFSEITTQHCLADNIDPEEMQLALAISQSEAEAQGRADEFFDIEDSDQNELKEAGSESKSSRNQNQKRKLDCGSPDQACESIRSKLKQYGFRTAKGKDYSAFTTAFLNGFQKRRDTKSKWANRFTALTLRNPEMQRKKLQARIGVLLKQQPQQCANRQSVQDEEYHQTTYAPISRFLLKCFVNHTAQRPRIIRSDDDSSARTLEDYFVPQLFEVSHVKAGHLLKPWHAIQGRDLSPAKHSTRKKQQQQLWLDLYNDLEEFYKNCNGATATTRLCYENSKAQGDEVEEQPPSCALKESPPRNQGSIETSYSPAESPMPRIVVSQASEDNGENDGLKAPATSNLNTVMEIEKSFECSTNTGSSEIIRTQSTRATSPDLFATDSDVDMEEVQNMADENKDVESLDDTAFGLDRKSKNKNDQENSSREWSHGITTYEIYSSDEVKTSPCIEREKGVPVQTALEAPKGGETETSATIDLTQEAEKLATCAKERSSHALVLSFKEDFQELMGAVQKPNESLRLSNRYSLSLSSCSSFDLCLSKDVQEIMDIVRRRPKESLDPSTQRHSFRRFNSLSLPKPGNMSLNNSLSPSRGRRQGSPVLAEKYKSAEELLRKASINSLDLQTSQSIDLTQDEDSGFLYDGDDEVNYSIRVADAHWDRKNNRQSASCMPPLFVEDLTQSSTTESDSENEVVKGDKELDELDAILQKTPGQLEAADTSRNLSRGTAAAILDFTDFDFEQTANNKSTSLKAGLCRTPEKDVWPRIEFGILESPSEPFTQSPMQRAGTPSSKLDDSFMSLPDGDGGGESTAPLRVFSKKRSTQKFHELLGLTEDPPPLETEKSRDPLLDIDDFDEFDRLVYGSPRSSRKLSPPKVKTPTGLDALLTGTLSFNGSTSGDNEADITPRKLSASPCKSPAHSVKELIMNKTEEVTIDGKTYTVRATSTPKPDFDKMPEEEISKRLYNFGIKPLKGRKAVKILEFIYNQTHPLMIMDDGEQHQQVGLDGASEDLPKSGLNPITTSDQGDAQLPKFQTHKLQDCYAPQILNAKCLALSESPDEQYIFQTNVSKRIHQALLPFHLAWYNLICAHPELYESILMYEPIDLQEVYLFLKQLGFRYEPKEMKRFFDHRGIIFRYDLANGDKQAAANRHVRKVGPGGGRAKKLKS